MNKKHMDNMDNRLDFVNSVKDHLETLTEDDTLLMISVNKEQGDLFFTLFGDWQEISHVMSNKDIVNHDETSGEDFEQIVNLILNTAVNICKNDPEKLNNMLSHFQEVKKRSDKSVVKADASNTLKSCAVNKK
jgi:hypothetical protein